jgi:diaminopimelate decarboxylase
VLKKIIPFSEKKIKEFANNTKTPFYLYYENGIRERIKTLQDAFSWAEFKEFFAIKATPNPRILSIVKEEGCGVDCSSMAELILAEKAGFKGDEILFTSNDTPLEEYEKALSLGATLNLDDIGHIDILKEHLLQLVEEFHKLLYNLYRILGL